MQSPELRLELARAADRLLGDLSRISLDSQNLRHALDGLTRRSSHYREALVLIQLISQGALLEKHHLPGKLPLSSFMLNMNFLFERFLARYLREHAPPGLTVRSQEHQSEAFRFLSNPSGWQRPSVRPDFVFYRRHKPVAIADAKYINRNKHRPSPGDLYQLTVYGLSYQLPEPRDVLLLHPLSAGEPERSTTLIFTPSSAGQQVRIRLVGVPMDGLLQGRVNNWWPGANEFPP